MNIKIFKIIKIYTTKILFNIINLKFFSFVLILFIIHSTSSLIFSQPTNWQRCYRGPSLGYDHQIMNFCKSDGNNYLLFIYNHYNNRSDIFKINEYGDSLLSTYILSRGADACVSSGDGGAVISAIASYSASVKINSLGNQVWNIVYPQGTGGQDIIKTSDNYYVMISGSMTKIDINGNIIWNKTMHNAFRRDFLSLVEAIDGGYVFAGLITDYLGGPTVGIVTKTDTAGVIIWSDRFTYNNSPNGVLDMRITKTSNGYISGGEVWSAQQGKYIIQLFTIGLAGNIKDTINYDNLSNDDLYFWDIKTLSDNRIIVLYHRYNSGSVQDSTLSSAFITDTLGNVKAHREYSGTNLTFLTHIDVTPPNTIMFAGSSNHLNKYKEWPFVVKTDSTLYAPPVSVNNISQEVPDKFSIKQNYPNPFNSITKIIFDIKESGKYKLIIYDVTGKIIKELFSQNMIPGKYEYDLYADDLASGVYFYSLITIDIRLTKKFILLK